MTHSQWRMRLATFFIHEKLHALALAGLPELSARHVRDENIADNGPAKSNAQPRQPARSCWFANRNGERGKQDRRGDTACNRAQSLGGRVVARCRVVVLIVFRVHETREQRRREQELRSEDAVIRNDSERGQF